MARLVTVLRLEAWRALCAQAGPVVVFKHSTGCGQSQAAYRVVQAWAGGLEEPSATLALVRVREERPLSLLIARTLGVRHASPQVIVLRHGRAVGSLSHGEITVERLDRLLAQAVASA